MKASWYNIAPFPKPRMTRADKWKHRSCVDAYYAFKDEVREKGVTIPQPCKVMFYIQMPESWSKKKKAAHLHQPHKSKPDIDNLVKALLDAVFENDAAIWSIWAEKKWAELPSIGIMELETVA